MHGRLPFETRGTISELAPAASSDGISVVGCAWSPAAVVQTAYRTHSSRASHAPPIAQIHPSSSAPIPLTAVGLYDHGAG